MYTFSEQLSLARSNARADCIDAYRSMLAGIGNPASSRISSDRQALARDLLYILLDTFSIDEVRARCVPPEPYFDDAGKIAAPTSPQRCQERPRPKISKFEQYPRIPWKELDNPLVRTADSIFSDRINCWSRLKQLEADTQGPTASRDTLGEIVETSVRLEMCFDELRNFNDTGSFLGVHPFIATKDERERVREILKNDPETYFSERKNIELNITRYSSLFNRKKATEDQREAARANLEKYRAKLRLYKDVFAETIKHS